MPLVKGEHKHESEFTQIPNRYLRDDRLSLQARGLYAQMLSHKVGWKITLTNLAYSNNIGRDAVRSMLNELMTYGYVKRSDEKERNDKGQLTSYTYVTTDPQPGSGFPTLAEPTLGEPTLGNPHHKNNNNKNNNLIEQKEIDSLLKKFLEVYPRKGEAKKPILDKLKSALKKTDAETIMDGAKRYAEFMEWSDQYVAMAKTWLNQERWEEEYPQNPQKQSRDIYERQRQAEYDYTQRQLKEYEEAAKNAGAVPKCVHGNSVASCRDCLVS